MSNISYLKLNLTTAQQKLDKLVKSVYVSPHSRWVLRLSYKYPNQFADKLLSFSGWRVMNDRTAVCFVLATYLAAAKALEMRDKGELYTDRNFESLEGALEDNRKDKLIELLKVLCDPGAHKAKENILDQKVNGFKDVFVQLIASFKRFQNAENNAEYKKYETKAESIYKKFETKLTRVTKWITSRTDMKDLENVLKGLFSSSVSGPVNTALTADPAVATTTTTTTTTTTSETNPDPSAPTESEIFRAEGQYPEDESVGNGANRTQIGDPSAPTESQIQKQGDVNLQDVQEKSTILLGHVPGLVDQDLSNVVQNSQVVDPNQNFTQIDDPSQVEGSESSISGRDTSEGEITKEDLFQALNSWFNGNQDIDKNMFHLVREAKFQYEYTSTYKQHRGVPLFEYGVNSVSKDGSNFNPTYDLFLTDGVFQNLKKEYPNHGRLVDVCTSHIEGFCKDVSGCKEAINEYLQNKSMCDQFNDALMFSDVRVNNVNVRVDYGADEGVLFKLQSLKFVNDEEVNIDIGLGVSFKALSVFDQQQRFYESAGYDIAGIVKEALPRQLMQKVLLKMLDETEKQINNNPSNKLKVKFSRIGFGDDARALDEYYELQRRLERREAWFDWKGVVEYPVLVIPVVSSNKQSSKPVIDSVVEDCKRIYYEYKSKVDDFYRFINSKCSGHVPVKIGFDGGYSCDEITVKEPSKGSENSQPLWELIFSRSFVSDFCQESNGEKKQNLERAINEKLPKRPEKAAATTPNAPAEAPALPWDVFARGLAEAIKQELFAKLNRTFCVVIHRPTNDPINSGWESEKHTWGANERAYCKRDFSEQKNKLAHISVWLKKDQLDLRGSPIRSYYQAMIDSLLEEGRKLEEYRDFIYYCLRDLGAQTENPGNYMFLKKNPPEGSKPVEELDYIRYRENGDHLDLFIEAETLFSEPGVNNKTIYDTLCNKLKRDGDVKNWRFAEPIQTSEQLLEEIKNKFFAGGNGAEKRDMFEEIRIGRDENEQLEYITTQYRVGDFYIDYRTVEIDETTKEFNPKYIVQFPDDFAEEWYKGRGSYERIVDNCVGVLSGFYDDRVKFKNDRNELCSNICKNAERMCPHMSVIKQVKVLGPGCGILLAETDEKAHTVTLTFDYCALRDKEKYLYKNWDEALFDKLQGKSSICEEIRESLSKKMAPSLPLEDPKPSPGDGKASNHQTPEAGHRQRRKKQKKQKPIGKGSK